MSTASAPASSTTPSARGLYISLAFWVSLLAAAGMFAAATLAPKLTSLQRREAELATVTQRVQRLVEDVTRLEQIGHALQHDADFIAARARRQLGLPTAGELQLPVMVTAPQEEPPVATAVPEDDLLIRRLAGDSLLRARLLTGSAALVLFAFTFLHERRRSEHTGTIA